MTQRLTFALTLAALSGGLLAAQQQPAPQTPTPPADQPPVTFRVEVNYVEVDAVVTDAQGNAGHQPHDRRLRDLRGRQAAGGRDLLARQHPDRARRAAAVCVGAGRGRRADQRARRGAHLSDRPRRRAHRFHADAARQGAATRFIERNFGTNDLAAVVFTGRAGDGRRTSPTTRGC